MKERETRTQKEKMGRYRERNGERERKEKRLIYFSKITRAEQRRERDGVQKINSLNEQK